MSKELSEFSPDVGMFDRLLQDPNYLNMAEEQRAEDVKKLKGKKAFNAFLESELRGAPRRRYIAPELLAALTTASSSTVVEIPPRILFKNTPPPVLEINPLEPGPDKTIDLEKIISTINNLNPAEQAEDAQENQHRSLWGFGSELRQVCRYDDPHTRTVVRCRWKSSYDVKIRNLPSLAADRIRIGTQTTLRIETAEGSDKHMKLTYNFTFEHHIHVYVDEPIRIIARTSAKPEIRVYNGPLQIEREIDGFCIFQHITHHIDLLPRGVDHPDQGDDGLQGSRANRSRGNEQSPRAGEIEPSWDRRQDHPQSVRESAEASASKEGKSLSQQSQGRTSRDDHPTSSLPSDADRWEAMQISTDELQKRTPKARRSKLSARVGIRQPAAQFISPSHLQVNAETQEPPPGQQPMAISPPLARPFVLPHLPEDAETQQYSPRVGHISIEDDDQNMADYEAGGDVDAAQQPVPYNTDIAHSIDNVPLPKDFLADYTLHPNTWTGDIPFDFSSEEEADEEEDLQAMSVERREEIRMQASDDDMEEAEAERGGDGGGRRGRGRRGAGRGRGGSRAGRPPDLRDPGEVSLPSITLLVPQEKLYSVASNILYLYDR